jgi:hypothetical protein
MEKAWNEHSMKSHDVKMLPPEEKMSSFTVRGICKGKN